MNRIKQPPQICLGCDIAKHEVVIATPKGVYSIDNEAGAICTFLKQLKPDLVICEPTGGYEHILIAQCMHLGINLHRVDTLKVKSFIRSFGQLGKSDALDASALARYGLERWHDLHLWQQSDEIMDELRALVLRRNDLVAMRVAETNRLKGPGAKTVMASLKALIQAINSQIDHIEQAIERLIKTNSELTQKISICTTMHGIGVRTAAALLGLMPELGHLTRRQAASLAGLAPHPNESGLSSKRRTVRGGRPQIAKTIFMTAMQASQGRGEFAEFYKRLIDDAKKPIVALTAVMRKIIITLNARIRDQIIKQS